MYCQLPGSAHTLLIHVTACARVYRIAANFQGAKSSHFSRIDLQPRKFSMQKFSDNIAHQAVIFTASAKKCSDKFLKLQILQKFLHFKTFPAIRYKHTVLIPSPSSSVLTAWIALLQTIQLILEPVAIAATSITHHPDTLALLSIIVVVAIHGLIIFFIIIIITSSAHISYLKTHTCGYII